MSPSEDDEDKALWAYVTRNVRPLEERGRPQRPPIRKQNNTEIGAGAYFKVSQELRKGREVDARTSERVRDGRMEIEGRLDLHGMTQDQARAALVRFITGSYQQGKRLVLVITGKGGSSSRPVDEGAWWEDKPGILRQSVPQWLDDSPLNRIVLQYHAARPKHGGEGALYVLLRRQR